MAEPRNIIGESFKKYVRDQVKVRQEKLGSQDRDTDLLKYVSNKTSWIRLSSGVNIDYSKAVDYVALGAQHFSGNLLAKKSVLFSARKYLDYTTNKDSNYERWKGEFTEGVGFDLDNPSYGYTPGIGLAGNDIQNSDIFDYGMVPPAGIISAEIKSRNRGSLRDAVVQISCHNLAQFRVIEALYLKLKYSMLLEWGHTFWYDNKGTLRSDMPDDVHRGFLDGKYNQDSLLTDLENRRKLYCGNYDAFLGWVTNFDWSLRKDGGYDITLNLISFGDVIESLKINSNFPSSNTTSTTSGEGKEPPVIANKNKSTINQILFAIQTEIYIQGYLDGFNSGGKSSLSSGEIVRITKIHSNYDLVNPNYKDPNEIWDTANNILTYQEGIKAYFSALRTSDSGTATGGDFYYIKLGTLLRIVESFLLKYDTSKDEAGKYKPLFYIDHDYNTNLCLTLPRQTSTDPRVCLLKSGGGEDSATSVTNKFKETKVYSILVEVVENRKTLQEIRVEENIVNEIPDGFELNQSVSVTGENDTVVTTTYTSTVEVAEKPGSDIVGGLGNFYRIPGYPFLGKFMHIHVNLDFISTTLENNIDEKGNVSVYKFLQQLMKGIQQATGQINNFDVVYDEVNNYYVIRDLNILPGAETVLDREVEITRFNVNILKNNFGSFVLDTAIKSTLNNSFASTIAIGAQVNGNKIGENSTALSKLNNGYIDRLITDRSSIPDDNNESEGKSKDPNEVYKSNLLIFTDFINKINLGTVTPDDISNNSQAIIDILKYELGYYTEQGNIPGAGFIPIDLQLTMDGLSGPRIYEVYNINEELLPDSYKNNIQFITIGVNHKIDENGWTTILNSLSGPRRDNLKPVVVIPTSNDTGTTGTTKKTELSNDELSGPDKDDSNYSAATSNNKTTLPLNTRLSKYATLQMVVNSDTARSKGIDNTPTDAEVENLKKVCSLIYDKIYEKFNGNVKINSGYRSKELNKAVGGVPNSAHLIGKALDIDGINGTKNSDIFNYIKNNISDFDQLIWEYGNKTQPNWVHISYDASRNRKSVFSIPSGLL